MKLVLKKTISILLAINLSLLHAEQNVTIETCILESSQPLGYTGDSTGKRLYTQEEFTYLCTKTTSQKGECNSWETQTEVLDISNLEPKKIYYETEDYSGSMGRC